MRRVLGLAAPLPGLRRVDLETNYRCPRPVVERAVRLVEHNRERFAKRIVPGPIAAGRLVLAPDAADDLVRVTRAMRTWPDDASTRAVLARTNRELLVAVVAALDLGIPFRAPDLPLPDRGRPDRRPARSGGRRRSDGPAPGRRCSRSAGCDGRSAKRPPRAATTGRRPTSRTARRRVDLGPAARLGGADARRSRRCAPPIDGAPAPARRAPARRRGADPGDRARDQGPRVGPRDRARRRLPGPPIGLATRRSRSARSRRSAGWPTSPGPARGAR